ncbi:hypothetical protein [Metabacillus fastidiosus]|uniref:hypothetical protein n=1 Tax=Metabacillus fastidiosus TaxID=1458 RepID=UPI002E21F012|nr:hypothetical protein [Metabacillus fastidiosus]
MISSISNMLDKQKTGRKRGVRSDKKKSVRVWVDDFTYSKILNNSKLHHLTITAYCSSIVSDQLKRQESYDTVNYQVEERVVHIKVTQSDYQKICSLSGDWMYPSIRQTVHRVFLNGLKREGM